MSFQERTEEATPKRKAEARRRGQVARSVELSSAIILLGGFFVVSFTGANMFSQLSDLLKDNIRLMSAIRPNDTHIPFTPEVISGRFFTMMMPLFVGLVAIGLVGNLVQTNMVFTLHPLKPDFSRLNPLQGLQRLFSMRSLVELAKSIAKLGIAGYVAYSILEAKMPELMQLSQGNLANGASIIGSAVFEIGLKAGGLLLVLAAGDYLYQRRHLAKSLMMSRQEIKEEMRHYEGSPELKARIRRLQRAFTRGRMMQDVPKASVVVTNPTHLAIALQYDATVMKAPKVVAKGQRLIAEEIKRIARDHGIPVVENKPLARSMWETVEIGEEIPEILYKAVAEILAFVYRLKNKVN